MPNERTWPVGFTLMAASRNGGFSDAELARRNLLGCDAMISVVLERDEDNLVADITAYGSESYTAAEARALFVAWVKLGDALGANQHLSPVLRAVIEGGASRWASIADDTLGRMLGDNPDSKGGDLVLAVHGLHAGQALCGAFGGQLPGKWPDGHFWSALPRKFTCPRCRMAVAQPENFGVGPVR